jgi:hypothetical protein
MLTLRPQTRDDNIISTQFLSKDEGVDELCFKMCWLSLADKFKMMTLGDNELTHSTADMSRRNHLHPFSQKLRCWWENI